METVTEKGKNGVRNQECIDPTTIDERFILNYHFTTVQKEAIKLIYEMRVLSTTEISIILDRGHDYIRKQLGKLYKNGFLYRKFQEVKEVGQGSNEAYWFLERGGVMFLAGAYGISMKEVHWDIRDNLIGFDKLAHSMKISEVRTTLEKAARAKGHKIENCLCDRHLFFDYTFEEQKYVLRPDLYFSYNDGNKIYHYFFEIDRGTMHINGSMNRTSTVISKVPKYENFLKSGAWKDSFEAYPRIIFLTVNKIRVRGMAESIKSKQQTTLEFLFSTFDLFNEDPLGENLDIYLKSDGSSTSLFK